MGHPVRVLAAALVVLAAAGAAVAQPAVVPAAGQQASAAPGLPRVRLIATGGTISNRIGGRLAAEDLVQSIPDLSRYVRAEWEQFANVASSEVTLVQWLQLARRINQVFAADRGLSGIVVTSGTDTLEELAYFLNLTVRDERPVAVVGSMRNPSTIGYEGAANLLEGFRVAADGASRNKGVLVVLNDEINAAREATKTDALRLQTFQTRGYGVLGVVDRDAVVYYRAPVKRHTVASEFDVGTVESLPRVDVILVYQDAPGDLIKAAVDAGAKGLVIAGAGAGATSGTQREGISYASSKGVVVVSTTRAGSGRVAARRPALGADGRVPGAVPAAGGGVQQGGASGPVGGAAGRTGATAGGSAERTAAQPQRPALNLIGGEDLAPVKARILLMLALAKTTDTAEIQRMFIEY